MKKILMPLIIIITLFILNSCGTINIRNHNYGNLKGLDETKIATLSYDEYIDVKKVNGKKVNWDMTVGDKVIKMPEGEYVFIIDYERIVDVSLNSKTYAYTKNVEIGPYNLEGGKKYSIFYLPLSKDKITFSIREEWGKK
jgi:hypothetical protein